MSINKCLVAFTVVLFLSQTACGSNWNTQTNTSEVNIDMQNTDLRAFNEEMNKKNIDIMLERIEEYPRDCKMPDFTLEDEYAGFVPTKTYIYDNNETQNIDVDFRLKTNEKENGYDATISITVFKSQPDSLAAMRNSLDDYSAPQVYPSSLDIGDFAIGGIYQIGFIRGNVSVSVIGFNEVEIDNLARAIDMQIMEILSNTQ